MYRYQEDIIGVYMQKKYGIWGFGVVGKSVFRYLAHQGHALSVMDKRTLSLDEQALLDSYGAVYIPQDAQELFFETNDCIIISPGIPRPSHLPLEKVVEELDLFCDAWKKKLIAVTGSLGKTSTVELLSQLLSYTGSSVALGGNVGTGMLDLLEKENRADYALLELSSFQLEQSRGCTPDLALWLNFYPNHLDRHHSLDNYFLAKYSIMRFQKENQKAIVPFTLKDKLRELTNRPLHFFSAKPFLDKTVTSLGPLDTFYGKTGNSVVKITNKQEEVLIIKSIPPISFEENWVAVIAALDILKIAKKEEALIQCALSIPEHRLEKVTTLNGVSFYNDSKSSIFEATEAAVETLQPQRIHLLLGGISKGVDRTALVSRLKGKVASVHCFGAEAEELFKAASKAEISAESHRSLEEACIQSFKHAKKGDVILFSPAGASFDLFSNYKERGTAFKATVHTKLSSLDNQ